MDTTLQIRIDKKDKEKARYILNSLGLDLSTSIKIFLKTVIREKGLPFNIRTENGFTLQRENEILKEIAEVKKSGKRYKNVNDLITDLSK
jgi:DNA-damage-inducible protein J